MMSGASLAGWRSAVYWQSLASPVLREEQGRSGAWLGGRYSYGCNTQQYLVVRL